MKEQAQTTVGHTPGLEKPDWYEGDNINDAEGRAQSIAHWEMAQIARAAIAKATQPKEGK